MYEQLVNGAGATITHDTTNRCALLSFSATPTGGFARMQSYEHIRYQPLKSQLIAITLNFHGGQANVIKHAGYSDGENGIELLLNGVTPQFRILSNTLNGDQTVSQDSWNLDKLDGTGPSGDTLDLTKTQIVIIDFQALYVGRVRVGFDIDGEILYVHEFNHANEVEIPYFQTANLPLRVGMETTATVTDSMRFICSAVASEGGVDESIGFGFFTEATVTAGSGTDTHILSIQPDTTFNGITNRSMIELTSVELFVAGNNPIIWKLCIGQDLTAPTITDVNPTYSAVDKVTGTLNGTPAIIIRGGYVPATNQYKVAINRKIVNRYPITLDAAGLPRNLGRLTLIVQGVGGTSETRAIMNWKEIR